MTDATRANGLRTADGKPRVRGLLGSSAQPPRAQRPLPPASSPAGIARTVMGVLAIPILVFVELGIETARTLGSVLSLRDRQR